MSVLIWFWGCLSFVFNHFTNWAEPTSTTKNDSWTSWPTNFPSSMYLTYMYILYLLTLLILTSRHSDCRHQKIGWLDSKNKKWRSSPTYLLKPCRRTKKITLRQEEVTKRWTKVLQALHIGLQTLSAAIPGTVFSGKYGGRSLEILKTQGMMKFPGFHFHQRFCSKLGETFLLIVRT